jgi:hypothetical protein
MLNFQNRKKSVTLTDYLSKRNFFLPLFLRHAVWEKQDRLDGQVERRKDEWLAVTHIKTIILFSASFLE